MAKLIIPPFITRASAAGNLTGVKGLGKAGETAAIRWINEHQYGTGLEYSNKYCDKGKRVEDDAIQYIAEQFDLGFIQKNTERKTNTHITGECDLDLKDSIDDVKCSWSWDTFPRFNAVCPNPIYPDQGQSYLDLWNKETFRLHYLLMDAPEDIILSEYYRKVRELALKPSADEIIEDLYDEVRSKMIFSHLPDYLRRRTFIFKRDEARIGLIHTRVDEVREIQKSLTGGKLI